MPVIQLPRDDRWGQIGQGLGNLIGGIATAYADKQTQQGVAEIMDNPDIAENKKGVEALRRFGDKGYSFYKEFVKTRVLEGQLKETLADVGLKDVTRRLKEAQLPTAGKQAEAELNVTKAQGANIAASTQRSQTLLPADLAQRQARTGHIQEETITERVLRDPRRAGAVAGALEKTEDVDKRRLDNVGRRAELADAGVPTPPMVGRSGEVAPPEEQPTLPAQPSRANLGTMLDSFTTLTPAERKTAENVYLANEKKKRGTGLDAALDFASKREEQTARAANQPAVPSDTAKLARSTASYGTTSERFLNEVVKDPSAVGLLSASGVKATLQRYGLPINDSSLATMLEAQKQLVAQQATSGGSVFMSGHTIRLAKDIAQNVNRTGLSNILGVGLVAEERLKEIDVERQRYTGNQRAERMLDEAAKPWQNIKRITDTLQTDVVKDAKGNERTVMYFMGNQVSPTSMKPLVKQDETEYKIRDKGDGRTSLTGVDLFNLARQLGKDPYAVWQELR